MTEHLAFEVDEIAGLVGTLASLFEAVALGHHVQHAAAVGDGLAVLYGGTGMEQDAVDMITSLSVFFRTSLSKGKDIIPLSEEKRHTLSYLEIQQSRYRDIMEFEINIPPELDEVMVPKLTLQPLAENALYHGIKNKRGKGKILIEGFNLGDDMMLRVTDNGQGMTPERLYEVQEAIRTGERAGFGLAAVSERIVLYYGPGYGLKISSTEGEGTVMEVYMAKKINRDNNSR